MAVNVVAAPEQMLAGAEMETEGVTVGVTVTVNVLLLAGVVTQPRLLVTTTLTLSFVTNVFVENERLFVPTFIPFTCH